MTLQLDEGRVFGERYWTVKPVPEWDLAGDWGGVDTWHQMVEWMVETFGPTPKDGVWTSECRRSEEHTSELQSH